MQLIALRRRSAVFVVATLAGSLGTSRPARAQENWEACSAAYEQAQVERRAGHLLVARTHLEACVRPECPETARRDCDGWLAEVAASIPTVVLEARDGDGAQLVAVAVQVDGAPFAPSLDGVSREIDPGVHVFRFEALGKPPIEREVTVLEGEKNQKVSVTWPRESAPSSPPGGPAAPVRPPPAADGSDGTPVGAWVVGGIGLLAMGSFTFFGVSALDAESDLDETCGPTRTCTQGQIDDVHAQRIAADVSLGVGVVALSVATVWLIVDATSTPPVDVALGPDHAELWWSAAF